jgi:hypothetical protein
MRDEYCRNREQVPFKSGSAEEHEEWQTTMECIYELRQDGQLVEEVDVCSKQEERQRDKDMSAAGEMLRDTNIHQFKKKLKLMSPANKDDNNVAGGSTGDAQRLSPMEQRSAGMVSTPKHVNIEPTKTKFKLSNFGDDVFNVLALVGIKDADVVQFYAQQLIENGYETPHLLMECNTEDLLSTNFRKGHAQKRSPILSKIENDLDA